MMNTPGIFAGGLSPQNSVTASYIINRSNQVTVISFYMHTDHFFHPPANPRQPHIGNQHLRLTNPNTDNRHTDCIS